MINKLNLALKEKFVLNYWCLIGLGDRSFLWGEELGGGGWNRGILRVASVVYDDPLFIRIFWVSPLSHKMTFLIRCHDTLTIVFKARYLY